MPTTAVTFLAFIVVGVRCGESSSFSGGESSSSSGTYCDACGADASYSETIDTSGTYAKRTIVSNGCPNHYNYCTGKDTGTCGAVGAEGTGTEAYVQSYTFEIPAEPVIATEVDTTPECSTTTIGMALNGVPIYGGAVSADCDILDVTASDGEWTSFDFCGGHGRCLANDCTGDYHCMRWHGLNTRLGRLCLLLTCPSHVSQPRTGTDHFPASCLETQIGAMSDGHSPQIGWSLDGFPVYGPFGHDGKTYGHTSQGCVTDAANGDYCLDECSGLLLEDSTLDNFKYRYYFNGPLSDLVTLPTTPMPATSDYPFAMKCYKGCTYTDLSAGAAKCTGGTTGVTSAYTATALTGVTAVFESSAATAAGMQCSGTGTAASPSPPSPPPPQPYPPGAAPNPSPPIPPPSSSEPAPPPPSDPSSSSSGCDGGCIGGIIGGCFVPVLLCILWLSGAFGDKCPSPLKPKAKQAQVAGMA